MSAVLIIPMRWKRFLWNADRKDFFKTDKISDVDKNFYVMKDKKINADDIKPKGLEEIPTYKDLMKQGHYEIDSTKVIDKPEIILDNKTKEEKLMQGWKTWLGVFLLGFSIVVQYVLQMPDVADGIRTLAYMFLGVGIAHKIEKAAK